MRKWEEKLLQWVRDNLLVLFLLFVTALGLVIRYSLKDFVSRDYISCLEKWYTTSKELGIRKALATQIGNYNMSYQLLIALITKLPINPLYAYKLISCVFDYTLAGSVAALVAVCMNGRTSLWLAIQNKTDVGWYCAVGYAATLFLPTVFMNSAQWAQCDAIYVTFLLLTLIACLRERNALSMILWGVAISFKLQAVFLFPFMLWVYLARRKHSILSFFLAPAAVVCISLPNILCGRKWTNLFVIYFDQMRLNEKISLNYASFWNIIAADKSLEAYDPYKIAAICLTVFLLFCIIVFLLLKQPPFTAVNSVMIAFLTVYTCVLFLPLMHERYGFFYEILAVVLAIVWKKTLPMACALFVCPLISYGFYFFRFKGVDPILLSVWNMAVFIAYAILIVKRLLASREEPCRIAATPLLSAPVLG